ncbi:M18 family aminopeptidase [Microlunatus elymi]|uniref:M18 family aminopeptidase n=1 Tax=Microlunatus elymi TaxID=2596828 RepID=A0A516Q366_9ACTN|nr:M18 family aminopeptidase [Microlunatus elymi]QDP97874.1 M18 family aminopeptidase [Microlunatus elymi]
MTVDPTAARAHTEDLAAFVVASPTPYHAAAEGARRLTAAGFTELDETEAWELTPGGYFIVRGGSLVTWRIPAGATAGGGYRIVGSHTDSPTFKLKPRPDIRTGDGWQQLGVEIYGGPLINTWMDRDLGLAGRLVIADGDPAGTKSSRTVLIKTDAMMRIPELAPHLDRTVNEALKLDRQQHTAPVWGVGRPDRRILDHLARMAGVDHDQLLGFDVTAYDTTPPAIIGVDGEFLSSGRLDNLSSVHASLVAVEHADDGDRIPVLAAFDHEEVGSATPSGAAGPILDSTLQRISVALGASGQDHLRALADSICLSSDTGHAVNPNYPGHHDPQHRPVLNGGPLLKINAVQRYATDAVGAAVWRQACATAGVPTQEFVSNNAVPCGSTIGPITATRLGITTVDVGAPLLGMHSARELAGVQDTYALSRAMQAFLAA